MLQLSIIYVKMLLLTGNIGGAYKVRNVSVYAIHVFPRHFFKHGAWGEAKARACLVRFSALKSCPRTQHDVT